MDNCFTGRRDRSRQTPEKDVLYIIPAGPVSSVHSLGGASYLLPVQTEWRQFIFFVWRVVCRRVLNLSPSFEGNVVFSTNLNIFIVFIHISASPGLKRGIIQHFITSFEEFLCTCRRDEVVGESSCVVPAAFLLLHRRLYLHDVTSIYFFVVEKHWVYVDEKNLEGKKNASSDVITSSLCLSRDTDLVTWYAFNNGGHVIRIYNGGIVFSTEVLEEKTSNYYCTHTF